MLFKNRIDAGQKLAKALSAYAQLPHHLVVGLPRGGVIVAKEVASYLKLPLEVVVARKIGAPFNPEFAIGALAGDAIFLNEDISYRIGASKQQIESVIEAEKKEAARREKVYSAGRIPYSFLDQTILLIDDGIATGATMQVSISFLQQKKVRSIVVATPVATPEIIERFKSQVDQVICLATASYFYAVGQFYLDFTPVTDEEVCKALKSQLPKGS